MDQEFDAGRSVYLDRDSHGTVLQLRHLDAPVSTAARTPQLAAADYLDRFADLLEIPSEQLSSLGESPSPTATADDVQFRYLGEKSQFDMTTVAYSQTVLGLPVFGAGVAVQLKTDPYRVISSQSSQHRELEIAKPSADALKRAESITTAQLASALGLSARDGEAAPGRKSLEIQRRELVVYRYDPAAVQRGMPPVVVARPRPAGNAPRLVDGEHVIRAVDHLEHLDELQGAPATPYLPLPPVPDTFRDGSHWVCVKVDFGLSLAGWGSLNWTAILDAKTLTVLYLRAHVDSATGLVFDIDPITNSNGPLPGATAAALNPFRVAETLLGLNGPVGGKLSLTGDTVKLLDSELPTVAFPQVPSGSNFDFDARSDNFSAVNAYVHTDRFFRLLDGMGFPRASYLGGSSFPSSVDSRGRMNTTDGIEINAHCVGTSGGAGIERTTFALGSIADTTNPIGIADDLRVVLHELGGHGVLYNHVHSANFGFSHSAGDSVAAILSDPDTHATDRFVTFPWVNIGRRHDRTPAAGWGWGGDIATHPFDAVKDRGGYNNEQILSTTMFRIYRSLGGDSTDLNTRRFAARMTVYLILRAIGTLTPSTNPGTAAGFETALESADAGDWTSENLTGGAYRKVIRWAFEKQGLFQPAGTATPNNNVGAPPAVDVYINDGRSGEYGYQPIFWENQNIWNRLAADGQGAHQDPVTNRTNYAYVKIRNRGTQTATNVVVKAFHANPAAGLSYPNDWIPMTTAQLSGANVSPNNSGEIVVGPFAWTPTHVGHECMFMIVTANGDDSNVSHIAAGDSIPEWRLVPHDNNVGQRNVAPVPGGTTGLTAEFSDLTFEFKNPGQIPAVMGIQHTLPGVLTQRGWTLDFINRGGSSFKLAAGESRDILMRLNPGEPFTAEDVENGINRTISVVGTADGIIVGGMSYQLDPAIVRPNRPGTEGGHGPKPGPGEPGHQHDDECGCRPERKQIDTLAEVMIRSLEHGRQRVTDVEIKKILIEVKLDDCD